MHHLLVRRGERARLGWGAETRAFFPDEATLRRVKALQRAYFLQLTQGDYGAAYLAHRFHIGQVHQQIGLEPRWYMGAYSLYMQLAFPRVMAAFSHDVAKGQRVFLRPLDGSEGHGAER